VEKLPSFESLNKLGDGHFCRSDNVINLFSSLPMLREHRLVCLSVASYNWLVTCVLQNLTITKIYSFKITNFTTVNENIFTAVKVGIVEAINGQFNQ